MQYIEAPSLESPRFNRVIFLAGGITNCVDWQSKVVEELRNEDVTVYNPRRAAYDMSNQSEAEIQIRWEWERLRWADSIAFWFSPETLCPITLFELGGALERKRRLVIGCHPDYARKFDVEFQCGMQGNFNVITDFHVFCNNVRYLVKS